MDLEQILVSHQRRERKDDIVLSFIAFLYSCCSLFVMAFSYLGMGLVIVLVITAVVLTTDSMPEESVEADDQSPEVEEDQYAYQKKELTPYQVYITQKGGTEKPFENEFWDNKEPGIYVDIVSGEPLFSSLDKFDSGTGWPSFTKPLESENIETAPDHSLALSAPRLNLLMLILTSVMFLRMVLERKVAKGIVSILQRSNSSTKTIYKPKVMENI